jgi:hypothetical protein
VCLFMCVCFVCLFNDQNEVELLGFLEGFFEGKCELPINTSFCLCDREGKLF